MFFINQSPEGMELILEDISLWRTFFGPAVSAYMKGDDEALRGIVDRYNQFITEPG